MKSIFDVKAIVNAEASAVRMNYYNVYVYNGTQRNGDNLYTHYVKRANRGDFAFLGGRSLLEMIWAVAKIGPTAIFEGCKSLYDGNFLNFPQTRTVAHKIIGSAIVAIILATGILFPDKINKDLLMITADRLSVSGTPTQEDQEALDEAGRDTHSLRPKICVNEEAQTADEFIDWVLKFDVERKPF